MQTNTKRIREEDAEIYREIARRSNEVIVAKNVTLVDYCEEWDENGKHFAYFGTKESYEKWKAERAD